MADLQHSDLGSMSRDVRVCLDDPSRTVLLLGAVRLRGRSRARIIKLRRLRRFRPVRNADGLGLPGDLDLSDESVDLVVAACWHERAPYFRWSLQEVARVLKVGGMAVICLPTERGDPLVRPMQAVRGPLRAARSLLLGRRSGGASQTVAAPREVLDELGLVPEAVAPVPAQGTASRTLLGSDLFVGSARAGQGSPVAFCCRKRDTSWRANPLLRDRGAVQRAMRRDYDRELSRLDDFIAQKRLRLSPRVADGEFFRSSVLLLSPHPDDELIGAGGTLMSVARGGGEATVLEMSNGWNAAVLADAPPRTRGSIRLDEAARVCAGMGVRLEAWSDIRDGGFDTAALAERLAARLVELAPDYVFVPFVADPHEDHAAANLILAGALRRLAKPFRGKILSYEVWTFCPANFVVDVSSFADTKYSLMNHYRTALRTVNYSRIAQWCGAWHGYSHLGRFAQAEAFFLQEPDEYLKAVDDDFEGRLTASAS